MTGEDHATMLFEAKGLGVEHPTVLIAEIQDVHILWPDAIRICQDLGASAFFFTKEWNMNTH